MSWEAVITQGLVVLSNETRGWDGGREVETGMEGSRGENICYSVMIHVVVLQKPIQHCKTIISN